MNEHLNMAQTVTELCKSASRAYKGRVHQFLIDFYELQRDPIQQNIFQSAKKLKDQHGMSVEESIQQAIRLRKDLFRGVWPDHVVDREYGTQRL